MDNSLFFLLIRKVNILKVKIRKVKTLKIYFGEVYKFFIFNAR